MASYLYMSNTRQTCKLQGWISHMDWQWIPSQCCWATSATALAQYGTRPPFAQLAWFSASYHLIWTHTWHDLESLVVWSSVCIWSCNFICNSGQATGVFQDGLHQHHWVAIEPPQAARWQSHHGTNQRHVSHHHTRTKSAFMSTAFEKDKCILAYCWIHLIWSDVKQPLSNRHDHTGTGIKSSEFLPQNTHKFNWSIGKHCKLQLHFAVRDQDTKAISVSLPNIATWEAQDVDCGMAWWHAN